MVVREIMTDKPITAEMTSTVRSVMELMYAEDIRHLPIVDGKQLVGIISERDLRSLSMPIQSYLDNPAETAKQLDDPISSIMRGDVISIEAEEGLDSLIDIMLETKVGAIPVVEPGTETLVGIASYIDILEGVRSTL